jgi:hypothetical protein
MEWHIGWHLIHIPLEMWNFLGWHMDFFYQITWYSHGVSVSWIWRFKFYETLLMWWSEKDSPLILSPITKYHIPFLGHGGDTSQHGTSWWHHPFSLVPFQWDSPRFTMEFSSHPHPDGNSRSFLEFPRSFWPRGSHRVNIHVPNGLGSLKITPQQINDPYWFQSMDLCPVLTKGQDLSILAQSTTEVTYKPRPNKGTKFIHHVKPTTMILFKQIRDFSMA